MSDETKTLKTYLVVNWKEETLRTRKTKPDNKNKSPFEFVIPINIDVTVPDFELEPLEGHIEVPRVAVESGLRASDAEHVQPDDWQHEADQRVRDAAENGAEYNYETVYRLVGEVLTDVDVYPDPVAVKQYVSSEYSRALRDRDD